MIVVCACFQDVLAKTNRMVLKRSGMRRGAHPDQTGDLACSASHDVLPYKDAASAENGSVPDGAYKAETESGADGCDGPCFAPW